MPSQCSHSQGDLNSCFFLSTSEVTHILATFAPVLSSSPPGEGTYTSLFLISSSRTQQSPAFIWIVVGHAGRRWGSCSGTRCRCGRIRCS
jgi:hypothetical protein